MWQEEEVHTNKEEIDGGVYFLSPCEVFFLAVSFYKQGQYFRGSAYLSPFSLYCQKHYLWAERIRSCRWDENTPPRWPVWGRAGENRNSLSGSAGTHEGLSISLWQREPWTVCGFFFAFILEIIPTAKTRPYWIYENYMTFWTPDACEGEDSCLEKVLASSLLRWTSPWNM